MEGRYRQRLQAHPGEAKPSSIRVDCLQIQRHSGGGATPRLAVRGGILGTPLEPNRRAHKEYYLAFFGLEVFGFVDRCPYLCIGQKVVTSTSTKVSEVRLLKNLFDQYAFSF